LLEKTRYELIIDNNAYKVKVKRLSKDKLLIDFGERKIIAKIKRIDSFGHAIIKIGDKEYNIVLNNFVSERNETPKIEVNAKPLKLSIREHLDMQIPPESAMSPYIEYKKDKSKFIPLGTVVAPFYGKLVELKVKIGDKVKRGQTVAVIEAMKMRNEILAPFSGVVRKIHVKKGEMVPKSYLLIEMD